MISYLKGHIIELDFHECTLLTQGGVGYSIYINEIIYTSLALEEDVELYIYHNITDNSQSLFGFVTKEDKRIFTELIKISGVGGKVAMQILSLGIHRLVEAVKMKDNKTIESIKGIGKKMAEKIILELKDKEFGIDISMSSNASIKQVISVDLSSSIKDTLVNMGYTPRDVDKVLQHIPEGMEEAGDIIPYVIRELS